MALCWLYAATAAEVELLSPLDGFVWHLSCDDGCANNFKVLIFAEDIEFGGVMPREVWCCGCCLSSGERRKEKNTLILYDFRRNNGRILFMYFYVNEMCIIKMSKRLPSSFSSAPLFWSVAVIPVGGHAALVGRCWITSAPHLFILFLVCAGGDIGVAILLLVE